MPETETALPIPSCAEAQTLGLALPQMLCDMEKAIGWPAVEPFLSRFAGQRLDIPVRASKDLPPELAPAFGWLRAELGFGRISIPLGPMRRGARFAWAIRSLSREGLSSNEIARRLRHDARSVQRYRSLLRAHGHDLSRAMENTFGREPAARARARPHSPTRQEKRPMIVNEQNLDLAFRGFKAVFGDAFDKAPITWDKIAMTVPSSVREETYGWLGQFPKMREWLGGERVVRDLKAHAFTIVNRKFESTVDIKREDFTDDRLGIFKPMFAEMGHEARQHPEEMIYGLLASGFSELCFDGQSFFDPDHPGVDKDGAPITISNMQAGAEPAWYLLDTSRAIKPIVWSGPRDLRRATVNRVNDSRVFMIDEYLYGVRARVNAGFGLWQLAHASRAPLTVENYVAARTAMMKLRGDQGRILGIMPKTLIVPPDLEDAALHIVNTEMKDGGGSNAYKNTAELIVTPYLDA